MNRECIGKKYRFTIKQKYIGHGGNGEVYELDNISDINDGGHPLDEKKYVVKILKVQFNYKRNKKYNRFSSEISAVHAMQEKFSGVMKILDYHIGDGEYKHRKQDLSWYLMYKAISFLEYCKDNKLTVEQKIKYMITIGDVLHNIHIQGRAHRDIKIDNILFLDGNIYLSDFGLIWSLKGRGHNTGADRIGPYYTAPPEFLENAGGEDQCLSYRKKLDYRRSDVYLFAKLVWACLKEDTMGFRGRYDRRITDEYLRAKEFHVLSFEPIHDLLEMATEPDISQRLIKIEKCVDLLRKELAILKNPDTPEAIKCRNIEVDKEIDIKYIPDTKIYRDFSKLFEIIQTKVKTPNTTIECYSDEHVFMTIYVCSVERRKITDHDGLIFKKQRGNICSEYLCFPEQMEIDKKTNSTKETNSLIKEHNIQSQPANGVNFQIVKDKETYNTIYKIHIKKVTSQNIPEEFSPISKSDKIDLSLTNKKVYLDIEGYLLITSPLQ